MRADADDMLLYLREAPCDLLERTRDLYTLPKTEMKKSKLELLVTKEGKEGKGKIGVCPLLLYDRNVGRTAGPNVHGQHQ